MAGRPLLAVVGLCGGAGASTLAYLVARSRAEAGGGPVLVGDAGGPTAGLASYAGAESGRSLPELANAIAAGASLADGLFADDVPGLRVIAAGPELETRSDPAGLARLLGDARRAHRLTVIDCGTLGGETESLILNAATHVAWVLPATLSGVRRAGRVLAAAGVEVARREIVVARHDAGGRRAPAEQLSTLAERRAAPLVLMPNIPDLAEREPEAALAAAALTLDAIAGAIRR